MASPNLDVISNFDNSDLDQSNTTVNEGKLYQALTIIPGHVFCAVYFPVVSTLLWYNLSGVCPEFLAENLNRWNPLRGRSVFVC